MLVDSPVFLSCFIGQVKVKLLYGLQHLEDLLKEIDYW